MEPYESPIIVNVVLKTVENISEVFKFPFNNCTEILQRKFSLVDFMVIMVNACNLLFVWEAKISWFLHSCPYCCL